MRCRGFLGCLLLVLAGAPIACGSADDNAPGDATEPVDSDPTAPSPTAEPPLAWLELQPLDIWGQPLPLEGTEITMTAAGATRLVPTAATVTLGLYRNGTFTLRVASTDHVATELSVSFDGATAKVASSVTEKSAAPGLLVGHEVRLVDDPGTPGSGRREAGSPIPVHTAYIGLRHTWFASSGRPARRGNAIELLMDGEEAWARVHAAIEGAEDDIKISTWWWQSDFELVRGDDFSASAAGRQGNTILGVLEASPARKRVMVGQFWSQDSVLSWITSDSALRARAETSGDDFEFMGQANVTEGSFQLEPARFSFAERVQARIAAEPGQSFDAGGTLASTMPAKAVDLTQWPVSLSVQAASYHQKFMTIDSDLAFVGGMNLRPVDWDTHEHRVFEPKRMGFDASQSEREDVASKADFPATGPRKDYMLRIQGPAAQDVNDVFQRRWQYLLDSDVTYAGKSTPFSVDRYVPPQPNGTQVQITTTLPAPFEERSIGESWFNAVRAAERYVFVEDQYFRVPMLLEALVARMQEKPELRLFVITKPVAAGTDPGCAPTARMDATLRSRFPKRYALSQLRSFDVTRAAVAIDETDAAFVDIDVHSKMLIVDDVFMSVGSANKNNRGILYEAEMNAAIVDRAFVTAARRRILANLLPAGTAATNDAAEWFSQLTRAGADADAVYARWAAESMDLNLNGAPLPVEYLPLGFVYSLTVPAESDCTIGPVGDDMVSAPPSATPSH